VYRAPVTGTRSPRIAYRQSLWLAGMWHVTRHRRRSAAKWQLKMASTFKRLVIWRSVFLFFGTGSLVKVRVRVGLGGIELVVGLG